MSHLTCAATTLFKFFTTIYQSSYIKYFLNMYRTSKIYIYIRWVGETTSVLVCLKHTVELCNIFRDCTIYTGYVRHTSNGIRYNKLYSNRIKVFESITLRSSSNGAQQWLFQSKANWLQGGRSSVRTVIANKTNNSVSPYLDHIHRAQTTYGPLFVFSREV